MTLSDLDKFCLWEAYGSRTETASTTPTPMTTRRNQTTANYPWAKFIDAINQTHGIGVTAPAYRDFVKVHVQAMDAMDPTGMSWGVHTMRMSGGMLMEGINFLSWHRWFVLQMEKRLQAIHPEIYIPYWDAVTDRAIPAALKDKKLLKSWGVTRGNWTPSQLASPGDVTAFSQIHTFQTFQRTLEGAVHAGVHNAVGGDMASASSPSDPLFWLHHANIDRLWSMWQKKNKAQKPANVADSLQPLPLFGVTVGSVQSISALGYKYA